MLARYSVSKSPELHVSWRVSYCVCCLDPVAAAAALMGVAQPEVVGQLVSHGAGAGIPEAVVIADVGCKHVISAEAAQHHVGQRFWAKAARLESFTVLGDGLGKTTGRQLAGPD